jgi:hypothetical protein
LRQRIHRRDQRRREGENDQEHDEAAGADDLGSRGSRSMTVGGCGPASMIVGFGDQCSTGCRFRLRHDAGAG